VVSACKSDGTGTEQKACTRDPPFSPPRNVLEWAPGDEATDLVCPPAAMQGARGLGRVGGGVPSTPSARQRSGLGVALRLPTAAVHSPAAYPSTSRAVSPLRSRVPKRQQLSSGRRLSPQVWSFAPFTVGSPPPWKWYGSLVMHPGTST